MKQFNSILGTEASVQRTEPGYLPSYALVWRQRILIVSDASIDHQQTLPPLRNYQKLASCLQHSPIKLVKLDSALGVTNVKLWADAAEHAHKPVFLRIPSVSNLPQKRSPLGWWLKRMLEWFVAVLLLIMLAPVIVGLGLFMQMQLSGAVLTSDWCVGERGKLFRRLRFCINDLDDRASAVLVKAWIQQLNLDKLPQLINVVSGEMGLIGPRLCTLEEALQTEPALQHRLNLLPGISGTWRVDSNYNSSRVNTVTQAELMYLHNK